MISYSFFFMSAFLYHHLLHERAVVVSVRSVGLQVLFQNAKNMFLNNPRIVSAQTAIVRLLHFFTHNLRFKNTVNFLFIAHMSTFTRKSIFLLLYFVACSGLHFVTFVGVPNIVAFCYQVCFQRF